MNAHNEQQALPCPFCGREPDLSFNSVSCGCAASPFIDREDALQVWNTRAAQASPVVKQNLTTQPAAAQEAVATVDSFTNGSYHRNYKLRWHKNVDAGTQLFAAPVTAVPTEGTVLTNPYTGQPRDYRDVESDPQGILIVNPGEPLFADNSTKKAWWAGYRAGKGLPPDTPRSVAASTTAAPGIDHRSLIARWRNSGNPDYGDCADDLEALIDASPKGDKEHGPIDPSWSLHDRVEFALRDAGFDLDEAAFVAEAASVANGDLDSPKGGSEAQDAGRYRFLRDVAHPDSDDGIAVTIQKQDSWGNWRDMHLHGHELDAGTDAAMQAQAGDAEVQP